MEILQPAVQDHGSNRLDRFAQTRKREAMDALQDATLTPFCGMGVLVCRLGMLKDATHREALHLHHEQRLEEACGVKLHLQT